MHTDVDLVLLVLFIFSVCIFMRTITGFSSSKWKEHKYGRLDVLLVLSASLLKVSVYTRSCEYLCAMRLRGHRVEYNKRI